MSVHAMRLALLCVTMALPTGTAWAEPPQASQTVAAPVDGESLAIARQIADIALPKDKLAAFVEHCEGFVFQTTMARGLYGVQITDPALSTIFSDYFHRAQPIVRAALLAKLPELLDGTARAYARLFSRNELTTILAFAKTPAGAKFLHRAIVVGNDDEITRSTADIEFAGLQSQRELQIDLNGKLQSYLKAHPDFAEKLREAAEQQRKIDPEAAAD